MGLLDRWDRRNQAAADRDRAGPPRTAEAVRFVPLFILFGLVLPILSPAIADRPIWLRPLAGLALALVAWLATTLITRRSGRP